MRFLLTGFDPFGGEKINPSYEAIKLIPDKIENVEIIKLELPTIFDKSTELLIKKIEDIKPDYILSIGQAGGRASISIEKIAINLREANIADNAGNIPINEKIFDDGEDGIFTNIPIKNILISMRNNGIPANISYSAGTYVCNNIMYTSLYIKNKKFRNLKCGFIHVPYIPEQVIDKNIASMELETISKAIEIAIKEIIKNKSEIKISEGEIY